MDALHLLGHARSVGIRLYLEDGQVCIEALPGVVSEDLRAELKAQKAELGAILTEEEERRADSVAEVEVFLQRHADWIERAEAGRLPKCLPPRHLTNCGKIGMDLSAELRNVAARNLRYFARQPCDWTLPLDVFNSQMGRVLDCIAYAEEASQLSLI